MKNRYILNSENFILGYDVSHSAEISFESDEAIYDCLYLDLFPNYKVIAGIITRRTLAEIEASAAFLAWYKTKRKNDLIYSVVPQWPKCTKTWAEIKTAWGNFKNNVTAATTRNEIDTLFDNAYAWLGIAE